MILVFMSIQNKDNYTQDAILYLLIRIENLQQDILLQPEIGPVETTTHAQSYPEKTNSLALAAYLMWLEPCIAVLIRRVL